MTASVDLTTSIAGALLPNPVMVAAGCAGPGAELAQYVDLAALGAVVTPSVSRDPRPGVAPVRITETAGGLLVGGGRPAPGLDSLLGDALRVLRGLGARPVVSIVGATLGEYAELADRLAASAYVVAVEVNLVDAAVGDDLTAIRRVLAVVRRETPGSCPVLAKLPCDAGSVVRLAETVADAGADAVVIGGPAGGLRIDVTSGDGLPPRLASGRLCGPAVKPLVLRAVWDVHAVLPGLPVVGVGGIRSGADALELVAAGATAVQVGTATLLDPSAPVRVLSQLAGLVADRGATRIGDLVGIAHHGVGDSHRRAERMATG